jgi:hypothetical protein
MARRSPKPETPLNQKQEELAAQESKLREKMQELERMIQEAPRLAEKISRQQREEILQRASEGGRRLDVSIALQDKRFGDELFERRRRGSLRKERREGRLLFLVLIIALSLAIIWLATHLHL